MAELKNRLTLDGKGFKATLAGAKREAKGFATSLKATFKGIGNVLGGIGSVAKSAFKIASRAGLALTTAFVGAVTLGNRFNKQMGEVRTMLGDINNADFAKLSKQVIKLSGEFGKTKEELTKGLYQALSAGVPADNALEFLTVAAKAATAGVTTVETAVDGLTTVINSYGLTAKDVGKVSDYMFTAVMAGKTTFEELSQNIGQVAGVAKAAGVPLESLLATIATTTSQGINTAKSITGIRGAIAAILKPSDALAEKLAAIGETGESLLGKGLAGAFDTIAKMGGGTATGLQNLIPQIEALPTILAMSGNNAKMAAKHFKAMADSTGATAKAFGTMNRTQHWDRAWQSILGVITTVGSKIDEVLAKPIAALAEKINGIQGNPEFEKWVTGVGTTIADMVTKLTEVTRILDAARKGGQGRDDVLAGMGTYIEGAFSKAAESVRYAVGKAFIEVVDYLSRKMPLLGESLGEAAAAIIRSAVNKVNDGLDVYDEMQKDNLITGAQKNFPNLFPLSSTQQTEFDDRMEAKRQARLQPAMDAASKARDNSLTVEEARHAAVLREADAEMLRGQLLMNRGARTSGIKPAPDGQARTYETELNTARTRLSDNSFSELEKTGSVVVKADNTDVVRALEAMNKTLATLPAEIGQKTGAEIDKRSGLR